MYVSAINVGARQFQRDERVRRLIENQDDQEGRLVALTQKADDVDGRYGDALSRLNCALVRTSRAVEAAEAIHALRVTVDRLRIALATLSVLTAFGLLASLVAR